MSARLFVAVWPTSSVLDAVEALPRPERAGVRWTRREQWHVTLRFLGRVEEPAAAVEALSGLEAAATEAVLGPSVTRLGRGVVCVEVGGLEEIASEVVRRTSEVGKPPEDRPFHGHLTLARVKSGGTRGLVGEPISGRWPVREVCLVESRLHPHGARYETVAAFPLVVRDEEDRA